MARPLRVEYPGAFYHVINRGNDGEDIIKRWRRGHLFQGRFKSLLVDADEYLKHLSRYIHLNPVRAKMVESASEYPWSSYPFFIGTSKMPKWFCGNWLLSQFGKNLRQAKQNYRDFVEESDPWAIECRGRTVAEG